MDYKKVLLLHFTQGLSGRSIAEVTGVSKSAINEFLKRFRESKELYYPLPEGFFCRGVHPDVGFAHRFSSRIL